LIRQLAERDLKARYKVSVLGFFWSLLRPLLTIAAARRRGKAIAALGVSLLLVGAAGWIGLELGRRYLDDMLGSVSGNPRQIAESFAEQAISSMHQWLNLALLGGGGLVLLGVIFTLLGSLGRRTVREPV